MDGIADLTAPPQGGVDDDSLRLYVMNVEYTEDDGRPITHVFGRDADAQWRHIEVVGHRPSFFIETSEYDTRIENHYQVHSAASYDEDGERYTALDGTPLTRIYTYHPKQVPDVKELFDRHWEADVFYKHRFLIDTEVYVGMEIDTSAASTDPWVRGDMRVTDDAVSPCEPPDVEPRTVIVDIEVASEEGMADPQTAEWPVSTIVAYDSYDNEYTKWVYHHTDSCDWSSEEETSIRSEARVFTDESDMLVDFNQWVADTRPDLLSGWYSNDFDYPYLITRSKQLNTWSHNDWSPLGDVWVSNGRQEAVAKGVTMFDMLEGYKKTQIHKLTSKSLDDVAQKEVDAEKIEVEGSHTEMWQQDPVTFLEYNTRDVELVKRIEEEQDVITLFEHLRSVTGALFDDCHTNIDMIDTLMLREAQDRGYRLPTARKPARDWYHGAYVFPPVAGLHNHVVYPDYSSLYPNMMLQCNMSPETLLGTWGEFNPNMYDNDDVVWSYIDPRPVNAKKGDDPEMERLYYVSSDVEQGFVSGVVEKLLDMKGEYKGVVERALYEAVKRVVNSCFTPDTDVLTPGGVRNITDVEVGDEVYSWNPETNEMEVKPVVDTVTRSGEETIHHIDTNGIDLKVTDDHDMWVNRWRKTDSWEKAEAGELNQWTDYQTPHDWSMEGSHLDTVDIREWVDDYEIRIEPSCHGRTFAGAVDWSAEYNGNGAYYMQPEDFREHEETVRELADSVGIQTRRTESDVPFEYESENFIKLVAWYTTEGSIYTSDTKEYDNVVRGECTTITIAQERPEHRPEIEELLDDMGLTYYKDDRGFEITGATALAEVLGKLCGRGSYDKQLPEWGFGVSDEQRRLLLETLMKGDGDQREQRRYTTASEDLRDDMCRLLVSLGETPRYGKDAGTWRVRWRPGATNSFTVERSVETEQYNGTVHCLTVEDNHTMLAGRNGNFTVVGNCYGVVGDSNSYGTGFRLFDDRLAESITLGGRLMLQDGADEFASLIENLGEDGEVIGGDTDSFMTSIESAETQAEAIETAKAAADEMNDTWMAEFVEETFGTTDNRMEIEVESYSNRCFFPAKKGQAAGGEGTKKRYVSQIVWEDGEEVDPDLNVKGFEYVRSDVAQITKDAQGFIFDVLMNESLGDAKDMVYDWLNDRVSEIKQGDYHEDLGIPFGIGQTLDKYGSTDRRPQPQYRGARYANQFIYGDDAIGEADKPLYYYVDAVGGDLPIRYHAETAEDGDTVDAISVLDADDLPDEVTIDRETMIEKTLKDPLEPIFRTFGWDFDDALRGTEQTSVERFM